MFVIYIDVGTREDQNFWVFRDFSSETDSCFIQKVVCMNILDYSHFLC